VLLSELPLLIELDDLDELLDPSDEELLDAGMYWLLELWLGVMDELELLLLGGRTVGGLGPQGSAHGGVQLGGNGGYGGNGGNGGYGGNGG
jgi:hypothetical protein